MLQTSNSFARRDYVAMIDGEPTPGSHMQNKPSPKVIKLFSCSTQLSTKFVLLINVNMPTIVGIITFISMINKTSERLKAINFSSCRYFSFL